MLFIPADPVFFSVSVPEPALNYGSLVQLEFGKYAPNQGYLIFPERKDRGFLVISVLPSAHTAQGLIHRAGIRCCQV